MARNIYQMKNTAHSMIFQKVRASGFISTRASSAFTSTRVWGNNRGFTLIEIMITVAIVGILAAIALPNYTRYVMRGHRADARNALLAAAQRMEQNYSLSGSYALLQDGTTAVTNTTLAGWGLDKTPVGSGTRYTITFQADPTTTAFTLIATPTGAQTGDSCGVLSMDNRNLKGANGQNNRSEVTRNCWDK